FRSEEFRQFARETEFIESIIAARLNQDIGEGEQVRDCLVGDLAELHGNLAGPFFVGSEEGTEIAAGANEAGRRPLAVQDRGGEVKAADIAGVRGMDVTGITQNNRPRSDSQLLQQLGIMRPRKK